MNVSADIARRMDALPEVMALVERFFDSTVADAQIRFPVELALEEIFTNVVRHNAGGKGPVRIELTHGDGQVIMRVTDFDTPRFDLITDPPVVDIDEPLESRRPGGLGIHLVKKMMDRIEYSHRDRTGIITLYKRAS